MPYSQTITTLEPRRFLLRGHFDYYRTAKTLISHYYEQFYNRLREDEYHFPMTDSYSESFGEHLQTNFFINSTTY